MDRSGRSTPHRSGRSTPYTHASNYTVASSLTTDDEFLLLSDSPSYEDIDNMAELEISITEHKSNIGSNISIEDLNLNLHQRPSHILMPQNSHSSVPTPTPIAPTIVAPTYTIQHDRYQILLYCIIVLFIILYTASFFQYVSSYNNYLTLYRVKILYVNIYNGIAILFYLFLIILCLIFGYQYKNVREYVHRTNKNALSVVLLRLSKANMSKRKKCINLLKFYKKIFQFEWTEFGIICSLTLLHYIVSGILMLSQRNNYKNTSYNPTAYILTAIRYILNGFAIILPALCINIYYDHIRNYLWCIKDSISVLESDHDNNVPPDIPEDQQTDAGAIHMSGKTNQTDTDAQSVISQKTIRTPTTVFNYRLIHWSIFVIFILFIITYQMPCTLNWDMYQHSVHILYGNNNISNNNYFIINELVLKLFTAMLLLNTCFHIVSGMDHTEYYGFVTSVIKPEHVLFVMIISFMETLIHSERIWNVICTILYAIFIIIVQIVCYIISSKLREITREIGDTNSKSKLAALRNIINGIFLMTFCVMTNSFILLHDHRNWMNIRQISCNVFNLFLLRLIYELKLVIDNKRCYKFIKRNKKFKMFFIALIILNLYHICYSIMFVIYSYQNISTDKYSIYYRLSFSFSFTIIQLNQWILCELLSLYVQIFPPKSIGTIASGSVAIGTAARSTKGYIGHGSAHHWRYSASGYPVKKSKYGARPRSKSRPNSASAKRQNTAFAFV
eukprot:425110_1